jgi:hypothetical protein
VFNLSNTFRDLFSRGRKKARSVAGLAGVMRLGFKHVSGDQSEKHYEHDYPCAPATLDHVAPEP